MNTIFYKIIIYKGDAILDLEGGARELWVTTTYYAKRKSGEKSLLCVYKFLLEFMPMCRYKYMCVACVRKPAIEGSQAFSSIASHLSFQNRITHWIWSVLTRQDWLAPGRLMSLNPKSWDNRHIPLCWDFMWFQGSELRSSCLRASIWPKDWATATVLPALQTFI